MILQEHHGKLKDYVWVANSWDSIYFNMSVSKNGGTPKSSILIGISTINHPFWDTPIFGNTHIMFCMILGGMRVQDYVSVILYLAAIVLTTYWGDCLFQFYTIPGCLWGEDEATHFDHIWFWRVYHLVMINWFVCFGNVKWFALSMLAPLEMYKHL